MKGIGKGLLGAVASPVSGVLDALRCGLWCWLLVQGHGMMESWGGSKGAALHSAFGVVYAAAKLIWCLCSCLPLLQRHCRGL